ncbi:unnamed protein product [Pleuronectes platessa]|uniref:Uncharacterized protein n=1 Tax=Pleuronectes platessa TaxID=8262 RepID=A0A9N7W3E8_PLEPL|nr:unnamed protein product [Pleuronectes platessa]
MWNFLQRLNASPICLHFVQLPCLGAGQSSERTGADTRSQRENVSARSAGVRTNFDVASRKCLQSEGAATRLLIAGCSPARDRPLPPGPSSCHTRPDVTQRPLPSMLCGGRRQRSSGSSSRVSSVSELTFPAAKLELVPGVSLGFTWERPQQLLAPNRPSSPRGPGAPCRSEVSLNFRQRHFSGTRGSCSGDTDPS